MQIAVRIGNYIIYLIISGMSTLPRLYIILYAEVFQGHHIGFQTKEKKIKDNFYKKIYKKKLIFVRDL